MFKWLLAFLPLFSCTLFADTKPQHVVVYGDDSYPPYSYLDDGQAKGIYTEILVAVFEQMEQYDVEITLVPWKRGLKLLELGKGFALYPPYYYADKRHFIEPYSLPILTEEVVVFCNNHALDAPTPQNWPTEFSHLTIGINESFALGGNEFWQLIESGKMDVRSELGTRHGLLSLYKGRTDCYINDRMSILWESQNMIDEGVLPLTFQLPQSTTVGTEQGHLAFARDSQIQFPYKQDFVTQFNFHLEQLKQDGTINKLVMDYIEFKK